MNQISLDEFLALAWSDKMRETLLAKVKARDVMALAAVNKAGRLSAVAYVDVPGAWPDDAVAVWCRALPVVPPDMKSKTQKAVDLVLHDGVTPFAAAKQLGIHPSAVYRALIRVEEKTICPCCGQVVREGFIVKPQA